MQRPLEADGRLMPGRKFCLLLAAALLTWMSAIRPRPADGAAPLRRYVGAQVCAPCHRQQTELWRTSHHHQAMQRATAGTVAGNFKNARFTYAGITSTFFTRGG